ncbi:hypothetical protein KBC25_03265 [Candidatus Pacearchaeota archaeon]|jgi:hypothetical protein|nr:hypothetical protein [Candidatus Pacearchaeota archaeon]
MKTIEYNLSSNPGKKIKLPEGTLAHVRHFFSLAESAKNKKSVLMKMLDEDRVFKDMYKFLKEDISDTNYRYSKYRLSKDKDLIYILIGRFELTKNYEQLDSIEKEINTYLNLLQDDDKSKSKDDLGRVWKYL